MLEKGVNPHIFLCKFKGACHMKKNPVIIDPNMKNGYIPAPYVLEEGDKINDNLPFTVGVEAKASKSVTLSPEWKTENLRVVVAAMTSEDGGYNWTVNNVNECKAGESISYIYAE